MNDFIFISHFQATPSIRLEYCSIGWKWFNWWLYQIGYNRTLSDNRRHLPRFTRHRNANDDASESREWYVYYCFIFFTLSFGLLSYGLFFGLGQTRTNIVSIAKFSSFSECWMLNWPPRTWKKKFEELLTEIKMKCMSRTRTHRKTLHFGHLLMHFLWDPWLTDEWKSGEKKREHSSGYHSFKIWLNNRTRPNTFPSQRNFVCILFCSFTFTCASPLLSTFFPFHALYTKLSLRP